MSDAYIPTSVPQSYDPVWLTAELQRIASTLEYFETPRLRLVPQNARPTRPAEGDLAVSDGLVDWGPGAAAGLYEYKSGAWVKL